MTNLESILKSKDFILPTKVCLVKAVFFSSSHVWMWELDYKECTEELILLNCGAGAGEDSWESLEQQGEPTSQS